MLRKASASPALPLVSKYAVSYTHLDVYKRQEKGCAEFASDCGLDNAASAVFHLRAGFAEAGRIICFTKRL